MRVCGAFRCLQKLGDPENRAKLHRLAGQSLRAALFAIDHADGRFDDETCFAQGRHGLEQRTSGGDNVLDETDLVAFFVRALDPRASGAEDQS